MDASDLLKLNLRMAANRLATILPKGSIALILAELDSHVCKLLQLARHHLRFAEKAAGKGCWRQRVSRAYYACYCASCAVRLHVNGTYSTDVSDHKKIGELPDALAAKWGGLLTKLRADRNVADYDHRGTERKLELSSRDYVDEAKQFLNDTTQYLLSKGVRP